MNIMEKEIVIPTFNRNMIRLLPDRRKTPGEECFPMHWHERMELLRVYEGAMDINFGDKRVTAKPGQLVIINPRQAHHAFAHEQGVFYDCIMFDIGSFYNNTPATPMFLKKIPEHEVSFINLTDDRDIINIFDSLRAIADSQDAADVLISISLVYSLLGHFYRKCLSRESMTSLIDSRFKEVLEYIDKHFCENITTSALSNRFGYSEVYFCRKFKSVTGSTVMSYIKDLRLNYAKLLLYETKHEINRISDICGFSDEQYFSNCFRKHFGMSPSQLRKEHMQ
ncbi:MAG: helix-turn-helix transcriptional regulator [Oscillospiraceae bacterium]|nr:helix-turn-helix transcriptional regulator [Oscillospiraceae bacterium]